MYKNCNIINSANKHKITFIMLHPMCCNSNYFNNFIEYIKNNYTQSQYLKNIKFIFPDAPIINIDYPENKLYNINSWYNYYSCFNGINRIDKIDTKQFNNQCNRIVKIINNEAKILNDYSKIYLGGVSQGGTLVCNILNKLEYSIGGIFCIKTIYMDKYIKLKKNNNTKIYIFSGELDNIYSLKLQKFTFDKLKKRNFKIKHTIIKNLDHYEITKYEHQFIIRNLLFSINCNKL